MPPVSTDFIALVECAVFTGENVTGSIAPDEGCWCGVMMKQIIIDCRFEVIGGGAAATEDALCGDLGGEALNEVQPGCAGGSEMELEAWKFIQPGLHAPFRATCRSLNRFPCPKPHTRPQWRIRKRPFVLTAENIHSLSFSRLGSSKF